ncbi:Acetyltransferase (GNAT) family protein [Loktanella atrilutea]|uniref:Acetyltransferase (GNAT) family protein n=1 Tax=Loktanella atrilutea TaxID=366533 RepID=A0A1M5BSB4_LOKAT|nr:GNAT family N-acetyltransferase [Loktanella atrilutea]SHF45454.1 Acetyltransferase (GNAT) family protein [Loktanella atrilutea]
MQRVSLQDLPRVRTLLEAAPHLAMFPLGNLDRYGLDGEAPRAPMIWTDGAAVLCVTREGMVMVTGAPDAAPAMARVLAGRRVRGIMGARDIARAVQRAAGLGRAAAKLDEDEPQFLLSLDRLLVPDGPGDLIPLADAPRDMMARWRVAYDVEALGDTEAAASARGSTVLDTYLVEDSHRVLIVDGQPVAMTGFNTTLPAIVQVGGVYTPPDLRGRGHARRAVALHLVQARRAGVARATLFASGAAAVRAYEAIGFERVGDWTLLLFTDDGVTVDG